MLIDLLGRFFYNSMLVVFLYLIERRKIDLKDKNFYFAIIVLNLLSYTLSLLNIFNIKPLVNILSIFFVDSMVLKTKTSNSIIKVVIMHLVMLIVELVFTIFIICVFDAFTFEQMKEILMTMYNSTIFSRIYNIASFAVVFLIFSSKFINNVYRNVIGLFNKISTKRNIFILAFIFFIVILTYVVLNYSDKLFVSIILFICLLITIMITYFDNIRTRTEYEQTKEKYSNIQHSLLEYEDLIDKHRVYNHENKNQLLTIQNMIRQKDPKVNEYIDDLVGTVYMNNEKTMMDVSIIPAGGLRATIHTKLNIMDDKKIKYMLNIDRKLRTIIFENIGSELNLKICKIVSIFLDNAIDEVDTHKANRIVNIEMYKDNNLLVFEVTNRFQNDLDINKIYEKRYTTKTDGHGYGLALAKEIIDGETRLNNYQKIEDDIFTQVLEVKIRN